MLKKIFFVVLIFITSGELVMRLDEKFQFLAANKIVKILTTVEDTPEFEQVKNNAINTTGNTFRVMVLGDSYIHGGGIGFKDAFSQQLKKLLIQSNKIYDSVYVLDISKPSSNSFDNVQAYFDFAGKFKPNMVILGYTYNDVEGNLDQKITENKIDSFAKKLASTNTNKRWIRKLYDVVYNLKTLKYALHNIHDEMKTHGLIMPNSILDLTLKSYYQNKPNWVKSKVLLQQMIDDCKKNNSQMVVLKFTEINLLEYEDLFSKTDSSIKGFFTSDPAIDYYTVEDIFKGEKPKDYILSKYDGHPNEKAHKKIADAVFEEIKKLPVTKGGFGK